MKYEMECPQCRHEFDLLVNWGETGVTDVVCPECLRIWTADRYGMAVYAVRDQGVASDGSTASYCELPPDAKELQDLISHRDMNAQIGEIFRACYRYGIASHSDRLRDAKKIRFYINAEIARLEKKQ